jgi:hypothetical protein
MLAIGVIFLWFYSKGEVEAILGETLGGVTAVSPAFADDINGIARLDHSSSSWNL